MILFERQFTPPDGCDSYCWAESEVEQPVFKLAPMYHVRVVDGSFSCYAITPPARIY